MDRNNINSKKRHELSVLEDVFGYCLASAVLDGKILDKLKGSISSDRERPDLTIYCDDRNVIIGLEHFRVDSHIRKDKKSSSKSAARNAHNEKIRQQVCEIDNDADRDEAEASALARVCTDSMKDSLEFSPENVSVSLEKRLFDKECGHANKLSAYRQNLQSIAADRSIELGYLIEFHTDFSRYYLNSGLLSRKLTEGECPLTPDVVNLIARASKDVDWILIGFYPNSSYKLKTAAIIDCTIGNLNDSLDSQSIYTAVFLHANPDFIKERASLELSDESSEKGDYIQYLLNLSTEIQCPLYAEFDLLSKATIALNLSRGSSYFVTDGYIQCLLRSLMGQMKNRKAPISMNEVRDAISLISRANTKALQRK